MKRRIEALKQEEQEVRSGWAARAWSCWLGSCGRLLMGPPASVHRHGEESTSGAACSCSQAEEARKVAAKTLMEEVTKANAALAQRKAAAKQAEKAETARIAAYVRGKDLRDQQLAEEREEIARQKELEVARLRAMQEKIQDTRSAEDEARAKRWQDEKELRERRKAEAEHARREAMQHDLEQSRVEQLARRAAQQERRKQSDQVEFERIKQVIREREEQLQAEEASRQALLKQHHDQLLTQVEARKDGKAKERETRFEEVGDGRVGRC